MNFLLAQSAAELTRTGQRYQALGVLLAQAVCVLIGLVFFYAAYTTVKQGFKITETNVVTGMPAKIMATVLAILGTGLTVFGIFLLPRFAY